MLLADLCQVYRIIRVVGGLARWKPAWRKGIMRAAQLDQLEGVYTTGGLLKTGKVRNVPA